MPNLNPTLEQDEPTIRDLVALVALIGMGTWTPPLAAAQDKQAKVQWAFDLAEIFLAERKRRDEGRQ